MMAQLEGAGECKEKQIFKRVFLSISVKESCLFMSTFHMHSYKKLMLLAQELNGKNRVWLCMCITVLLCRLRQGDGKAKGT